MCHTALSVSVVGCVCVQLLVCLWWGAYVCHTALSESVVGVVRMCAIQLLVCLWWGWYVCVPYSS